MTDLLRVGGRGELLARLCELDPRFHSAYGQRVESLVVLIDAFGYEIDELNATSTATFRDHAGYHAIQHIPGIGPTIGAILVAEIGDVHRFGSATHLASWC
jgi:transposase